MYEAAVFGAIVLMVISAVDYIRRAWIGETHPVPATWILMVVTMALSFWVYWHSPQKSWTANIGIVSALVNTSAILIGVIAANIRYGTLRVAFDRVQKWCLAGGAGVVVFWSLTDKPLTSYILVQCIALIGYFATMQRLWKAKRSTEPVFVWATVLLACLCALYPAWVRHDQYAWIYLSRGIPSSAIMIYMILRIKKRVPLVRSTVPSSV